MDTDDARTRQAGPPGSSGDPEEKSVTRRLLARGTEALAALMLVLVFFMGFIFIISFSFPQGTSLRDLMLGPDPTARNSRPHRLDLDLGQTRNLPPAIVARLVGIQRTVKDKRSGAITWQNAHTGMPLENRHSVQTYSRSGADISFGNRNLIHLAPKSLIVIRRAQEDLHSARRGGSMLLLDGSLKGGTDENESSRVPLEILTGGGSSLIVPAGGSASNFDVSVNPDNSSTFSVRRGSAEVVSGGKRVTLRPDQSVTVAGDEAPGTPQTLPGPPEIVAPAHGTLIAYRSQPPRVRFGWEEQRGTDAYHIEIGRDPGFEDLAYEGRVTGTEFVHGNLKTGRYYWRVAGLSGWARGRESDAREVELAQDNEPPELSIEFPDRPLRDAFVMLRGTTEPGAEIFIGDRIVPTSEAGDFEYALELQRGPNVVVVEAVDAAGNIAYRSKTLNAKYQEVKGMP